MKISHLGIIITLIIINVILFIKILLSQGTIQFFNPQGFIAIEQKKLLITYVSLMLLIVVPVVLTGYFIAWKYRSSNTKADFAPDRKQSAWSEIRLWIPSSTIILIMSFITWQATHNLDPYKPLVSSVKPIRVQVIALQWKWLFIYPEQGIATVNYLEFPEKTPLNFELTADSPMNSFWIPQLGGQMYAMTGMTTRLHLIADKQGEYRGSTAEISGAGFAGMKFMAKAVSQRDFELWVNSVKQSPHALSLDEYKLLAKPSEDTPPLFYNSTEDDLFNTIIMKFMAPISPTGAFHMMENGR